MTRASFSDYDEFASEVIDDAIGFLSSAGKLTQEQSETMLPAELWKLATDAGWKAPELP
jgi:hypothetical protein